MPNVNSINNPRSVFDRDGFVAIPGFLDVDELAELHRELDRFMRDVLPMLPREQVYYEDRDDLTTLKQVQHLAEHDAYFQQLAYEGAPRRLAEQLLDEDVVPRNMQYFNKPPGVGQPTPPHQDGHYFMLKPCRALTMWLAIDDVDEINGCIRYVRGSHRQPMRTHGRTPTLGFSQGITDYGEPNDLEHEVAIDAQPGDLLAHHAMTIHRADGNRSTDRHRRALGFIYYAVSAKEDTAQHAAYQRQLARDLETSQKI